MIGDQVQHNVFITDVQMVRFKRKEVEFAKLRYLIAPNSKNEDNALRVKEVI